MRVYVQLVPRKLIGKDAAAADSAPFDLLQNVATRMRAITFNQIFKHNANKNIPTPAFAHRCEVRLSFRNAIHSEVTIFLSPLQNDFIAPFDENSYKLLAFYLYEAVRAAINSSPSHPAKGLLRERPIACLLNYMGVKHFSEEVDPSQTDQG